MKSTTLTILSGPSYWACLVLQLGFILSLKKYWLFLKKSNLKRRFTAWSYLLSMLSIHVVFALLDFIGIFKLTQRELFIAQFSSSFIILISAAILFFQNNGNPEDFTLRLLVLTTTQMLGYLSVLLALIYTNQPIYFIFYLLGLSLAVLVIQTSYIVRRLK